MFQLNDELILKFQNYSYCTHIVHYYFLTNTVQQQSEERIYLYFEMYAVCDCFSMQYKPLLCHARGTMLL